MTAKSPRPTTLTPQPPAPQFQVYNTVLRRWPAAGYERLRAGGNLYATSIYVLVSAVIKVPACPAERGGGRSRLAVGRDRCARSAVERRPVRLGAAAVTDSESSRSR